MQFRIEAYNLFNHANMFPNTNTADVSSFTGDHRNAGPATGASSWVPSSSSRNRCSRYSEGGREAPLFFAPSDSVRGPASSRPQSCWRRLVAVGIPEAGGVQRTASAGPAAAVRPIDVGGSAAHRRAARRRASAIASRISRLGAAGAVDSVAGGRRQALAARVAQGDVDSVVNLLLFGTSFTKAARITAKLLRELDQRWKAGDRSAQDTLTRQYQQRAADLVAAAADPGAGERMRDVRRVLAAHGHDVTTANGRRTAIDYLFENVARVREEAAKLAADSKPRGAPPMPRRGLRSDRASSAIAGSPGIPRC